MATNVRTSTFQAGTYIASRTPFVTSGALRGLAGNARGYEGMLPRANIAAYRAHGDAVTFTVLSYGTPIAYHVDGKGWVVPAVKYSVTTSRHQGVVHRAVSA